MARGGHASPVASVPTLPKVSFQKIEDDVSTQPSGVHDGQARSFGYNDFSEFYRPDQYIRHIEPLEVDLERQVEYDMDEQDQEWLDAVNKERKKEQLDKVTNELFEVVMDRLDKEWFNLTKHIPKPDLALPSEDSTCAICDDSEGENSNAIVFCDGCNLAVHQDCYGVPYIPEGQWLCRKCTVSPENPVSCILCPNEGGAFKQTIQGEWIHLLCAIWVPETRVSNDVFMEPIIGVDKISKQRWKLKCSICHMREGACIQCAKQSCFLAFHVTCARRDKLMLPMKSAQGVEPGALTCYCEKHLPKEQADIREAALKDEEEQDEDEYNSAKLSKSARAYAKTYKPGPPLVPAIIMDRILQYISRTTIRKKQDFIAMMCRYWSLKREVRRGAPLLKRLHLEPWTAGAGAKREGEEEKVMKLEQLQGLRKDLEDLKGLTELSRKRESRKLKQTELIHDVISCALFPHLVHLRSAFEKIMTLDRNDYFKSPVNKNDVPDYFDVVKNPMSWSDIEHKLDNYVYWDIQSFKDDIQLVLDNAVLYNKGGTPFHKTALRIQAASQPILAELSRLSSSPNFRPEQMDEDVPPWAPAVIGDLEPPMEILELLLSTDAIKDELELILSADPVTSLFNFEFGRKKPVAPPPTPPPHPAAIKAEKKRKAKEVEKEKRLLRRQAEKERKEKEKMIADAESSGAQEDASAEMASAPPDIRVPRTPSLSRRPSGTIPPPGDIPLVDNVDDVDNFNSFQMFDKGWILPAGHRRNNRPFIERSTAPPPKKRIRLDHGSSRLSVVSTAASENQTLQTDSPYVEDSADNSMDVDTEERPGKAASRSVRSLPMVTPDRAVIPPPNVIHTPDGKVIIEELDTPAIRKEKNMRRREERLAAATTLAPPSQSDLADPDLPSTLSSMSGDVVPKADEEDDVDAAGSELSALSDDESSGRLPEESDAPVLGPLPRQLREKSYAPALGLLASEQLPEEFKALALSSEQLPDASDAPILDPLPSGLLEKSDTPVVDPLPISYPWWPAIVFDDKDPMIPVKVLAEAQIQRKRRKGKDFLYIVRFYDKTKSW
ncbi:bromodomain and PHD finger-containing protein 3, partial [Mycena pura]